MSSAFVVTRARSSAPATNQVNAKVVIANNPDAARAAAATGEQSTGPWLIGSTVIEATGNPGDVVARLTSID